MILLIVIAALWLAYSNGANDNFKGVATLYGSDTTTYKGCPHEKLHLGRDVMLKQAEIVICWAIRIVPKESLERFLFDGARERHAIVV